MALNAYDEKGDSVHLTDKTALNSYGSEHLNLWMPMRESVTLHT